MQNHVGVGLLRNLKDNNREMIVVYRQHCWSNKQDVVGSIPVTTEYFFILCDSNQVPNWFGTHYKLVL